MEQIKPTMPLYRCHKQVHEAQVIGVHRVAPKPASDFSLGLHECGEIRVSAEWQAKHQPEVGGYLVQYEDGYLSYSPKEAFEKGYAQEGSSQARMHALASELKPSDRTVTIILREAGEGKHQVLVEAIGMAPEQVPLVLKFAAEGTAAVKPTVERG